MMLIENLLAMVREGCLRDAGRGTHRAFRNGILKRGDGRCVIDRRLFLRVGEPEARCGLAER